MAKNAEIQRLAASQGSEREALAREAKELFFEYQGLKRETVRHLEELTGAKGIIGAIFAELEQIQAEYATLENEHDQVMAIVHDLQARGVLSPTQQILRG